jgi:hypothetical protein
MHLQLQAAGWVIAAIALAQIPGWAAYVVYKQKPTKPTRNPTDLQFLGLETAGSSRHSRSWIWMEVKLITCTENQIR